MKSKFLKTNELPLYYSLPNEQKAIDLQFKKTQEGQDGRTYSLIGLSEKDYNLSPNGFKGKKFWLGALILAKTVFTLGFAWALSKTIKEDWETFRTGKRKVAVYSTSPLPLSINPQITQQNTLTNPTRNDPKNDIAKTQAELEQEKLKEAYTRAFPNCDLEAIKACVEAGCSVNNPGRYVFDSPLYLAIRAVRRDNFEEVKQIIDYLVEKGANVNQKDSTDRAPIHYAIETNNLQMVQLLISYGADKNIKYQQVPMFSFSAPDPEKNLLDYTQEKLKSNLSIKDKDNQYRKEAEAILQLFKEDASPLSSNDNQ